MSESAYRFDNEALEAGGRFDALASLFDPVTIRHVDRLGIGEGSRCLEIGAGGGSVATWMAARVGASGEVLATDLDVRWLEQRLRAPNVRVMRHNVLVDDLPDASSTLCTNGSC